MAPRTKAKLEDFLNTLESKGCLVKLVTKNPQVYCINNELVNIRSKSQSQQMWYGRKFLFSITFSILQDVKSIIYLTTDSDHFMMFPSGFLASLRDRMYPDTKNAGVGVFDIDWDNEMIVLKEGELIPVREYYFDLTDEGYYPKFLLDRI